MALQGNLVQSSITKSRFLGTISCGALTWAVGERWVGGLFVGHLAFHEVTDSLVINKLLEAVHHEWCVGSDNRREDHRVWVAQ